MAEAEVPRVLIDSDRQEVAAELAALLEARGARPRRVESPADRSGSASTLLFLDLVRGGPDVRRTLAACGRDCEVVVLVDHGSFELLLPALAAGACDYLFLPLNPEEVGLRWERHRAGRGGTRARRRGLPGDLGLEFASRVELPGDVVSELRPGEVFVTVTDEGRGFDPAAVEDPTRPENLGRSHGRGLFLLRSLADEVRFNETGNSVTLVLHG